VHWEQPVHEAHISAAALRPKQTQRCKKTHIRVWEKFNCLDKRCLKL